MRSILPLMLLGVLVGACLVGATGKLPAFTVERWVNSMPLTAESLRGKVVLLDIWEYTCINWIRTSPYVKAWHRDYAARGLVVVGVHSGDMGNTVGPSGFALALKVADLFAEQK